MKPEHLCFLLPVLAPPILVLPACVATPTDQLASLRAGQFVEAKGNTVDGVAMVREIDEVQRTADDTSDKTEVTATVERCIEAGLRLLGHDFKLVEDTEFEGANKQKVAPFSPAIGDWLRVKARKKANGETRVRSIRAMEPRDQFKVTGEILGIDLEHSTIDVGGIVLPLAQDADLALQGQRPTDPLALFLADDQKAVPLSVHVGETVRLGGQASAEVEWNDEFDLDEANDGDRTKPTLEGKLDVLWLIDRGSYALGEITFGRADTIREGSPDTYEEKLEVTRAYASVRVLDGLQLIAGRQDLVDGREWLYDEVLDGARLLLRQGDHEFEVGGAVGREVLAEDSADQDTGVLVARTTWDVNPDWAVSAYVLKRTDEAATRFEPLLYGVQSRATPRYGLGHWLELGGAGGDDGNRPIRGYAYDVGVLYAFDAAWRPSLGAGIAFGSGEASSASTVGYRQSGLQDNNGKLGGVTKIRYYGELVDPELANLMVTTLVASVRPFPGFSLSALFHGYRQDVASNSSAFNESSALRTDPTGTSRDLGFEFDFIAGYRLDRRLTVELVAGRFEPGSAFAEDSEAHILNLTTRVSF